MICLEIIKEAGINNEYGIVENVEDYFELKSKQKAKIETKIEDIEQPKEKTLQRDFNKLDNKSYGWTPYVCLLLLIIAILITYNILFGA